MVKDAPFSIWSDHLARTDNEEFLKRIWIQSKPEWVRTTFPGKIVSQAVPHRGKVSEDQQRKKPILWQVATMDL